MRVVGDQGGIAAAVLQLESESERTSRVRPNRCVSRGFRTAARSDASRSIAWSERLEVGFDGLLNEHRRAWSRRWEDADVVIEGDDELQTATRFALFHLMGSVGDRGEAAVGARGLSGQSYRGHVFWDADTFVLPFLAATHPPAARSMLEYRLRRLAGGDGDREAGRARRCTLSMGVGGVGSKR